MAEPRILVDSSIWIEGFDPRGSTRLRETLRTLIETGKAAVTEIIRLEVIGGSKTEKEFKEFRSDFSAVECLETTDREWRLAEDLGFNLNRKGQRVPAADLLISAAVISYKTPLWHADSDFERVRAVASDFNTYWHPKHIPAV